MIDCRDCGELKAPEEFWKANTKRGRRLRCNSCERRVRDTPERRRYMADAQRRHRDRRKTEDINAFRERERGFNLKGKYGVTLEQYDAMLMSQDGLCRICKRQPINGVAKRLHVDHDHATGAVRGLLCHGCNTGLGAFADDIERLRDAIEYLQETTQ